MNQEKSGNTVILTNKTGSTDYEEHVMNFFFKDTIFTTQQKEEIIKSNESLAKFIELADAQNQGIYKISTSSYRNIHDNLEILGKKIIFIEEKIKKYETRLNNFVGEAVVAQDSGSDYKTIPQIEHEIFELNEKVRDNQRKIADNKAPIEKLNKTMSEDLDYISKIAQERKSIVDTMKEKHIINLTYQEGFKYEYQYELMQILLQEVNKVRFEERVKEQVQKDYKELSLDLQTKMEIEAKRIMIFDNFKTSCFNAWKFKNQILALEGLNLISKSDINSLKERLENIRNEALSIKNDETWEKFFEQVYKVLKVLLFLTVGQKKIEASKTKLQKMNSEVTAANINISEYNGKITLLKKILEKLKSDDKQEMKLKVSQEKVESPHDVIIREYREFLRDLKSLKNSIQINFNSFLKQMSDSLIKPSDFDTI